MKKMAKRIQHIEEVIMSHKDILVFETGKEGEWKLKEMIETKNYKMLLKWLLNNQDMIMDSKMRANSIRM